MSACGFCPHPKIRKRKQRVRHTVGETTVGETETARENTCRFHTVGETTYGDGTYGSSPRAPYVQLRAGTTSIAKRHTGKVAAAPQGAYQARAHIRMPDMRGNYIRGRCLRIHRARTICENMAGYRTSGGASCGDGICESALCGYETYGGTTYRGRTSRSTRRVIYERMRGGNMLAGKLHTAPVLAGPRGAYPM